MSAPTIGQLRQRHDRTWMILDFFGGWVAIRRHSWSEHSERLGIRNVLGADTLADLAVRLDEQTRAEARCNALRLPDPRTSSEDGGIGSS